MRQKAGKVNERISNKMSRASEKVRDSFNIMVLSFVKVEKIKTYFQKSKIAKIQPLSK